MSYHHVGSRFPHRAERYRLGGPQFSCSVCWSCRHMEGFLIRAWDLILPGCSGSSLFKGQLSTRADPMSPNQSANHAVNVRFRYRAERYRPGGSPFLSPVCRRVRYRRISNGNVSSLGAAGPRGWPDGLLPPRAGSVSSSQSAITQWGPDFHTARGGIDRGDPVFVAGMLEL